MVDLRDRIQRRPAIVTLVGVAVVAVIALGGWFVFVKDDSGHYCEDLQAWADESAAPLADDADLATSTAHVAQVISTRLEGAQQFSGDAPQEVRADWELFRDRLNDIVEVLKDAGYDLTDPSSVEQYVNDLQSGALNDLDPQIQSDAAAVQARLSDADATSAINSITDHAQRECQIELSLSGTTN